MPGGRRTVMERTKYLSPWQIARQLGLTVAEFKGRVKRGHFPQPTRIISGRWNFDQAYADRIMSDQKFRDYTRLPKLVDDSSNGAAKRAGRRVTDAPTRLKTGRGAP